jgi:hypothetical protein
LLAERRLRWLKIFLSQDFGDFWLLISYFWYQGWKPVKEWIYCF